MHGNYPVLTFKDIQNINWFIADTIRDKGNGASSDYKSVAVPLIVLKRFLDMREEYKRNKLNSDDVLFDHVLEGNFDTFLNNSVEFIANLIPDQKPYLHKDGFQNWYDIEWDDIEAYQAHSSREMQGYKLGNNEDPLFSKRATIQTNAGDRVEFLYQIANSFWYGATDDCFRVMEFEKKSRKILPNDAMLEIINELGKYKFDLEHAPEDVFGDAYMDLMGRFASDEGKKGGEFFTPSSLVSNGVRLLQPKMKEKGRTAVSDITSGACTFMTYAGEALQRQINPNGDIEDKEVKRLMRENVDFITQEKAEASELLGRVNMMLHGYTTNHFSYLGNTITEWGNKIGQHKGTIDYLFANPPYGLKDYGFEYAQNMSLQNESRWQWGVPPKGEGEYAFLNSIIDLLNSQGKALVVMPLGTLFKNSTRKMRERYINADIVEGIINLPDSLFYTTGIPVCLWILNMEKDDADKGKIFMVNAEDDFKKVGNIKEWLADKAVEHYTERKELEGYAEYVSYETLAENDFNLAVTRYVYEDSVLDDVDINELLNEIDQLKQSIVSFNSLEVTE